MRSQESHKRLHQEDLDEAVSEGVEAATSFQGTQECESVPLCVTSHVMVTDHLDHLVRLLNITSELLFSWSSLGAVTDNASLYDMDIVFDPPGSGMFSEVYLYEELMEADLHAIVSRTV